VVFTKRLTRGCCTRSPSSPCKISTCPFWRQWYHSHTLKTYSLWAQRPQCDGSLANIANHQAIATMLMNQPCLMGFFSFFVLGDVNSPFSIDQHADHRSLTCRIWIQCLEDNGHFMREYGSWYLYAMSQYKPFRYPHNLTSLVYLSVPYRCAPQQRLTQLWPP